MSTKAIIASALLTAVFAGQAAIAGQASDTGVFATNTEVTQSVVTDKVNYDAPSFDNSEIVVSGRK